MLSKLVSFLKKQKRSVDVINDIDRRIAYQLQRERLLSLALQSDEPITRPRQPGERELIVSMTTHGKRIHDVHLVVESIARQSLQPHGIVLWLSDAEFCGDAVPRLLRRQEGRGLEIRYCPDYRSYKKLVPALEQFPQADIVTIDDDILYPHDMIEMLVSEHRQWPGLIVGHRAHRIRLGKQGRPLRYIDWELDTTWDKASADVFLTTGGGTLFPAGSLSRRALDADAFMRFCPSADDIWVKAMSLLSNVQCKKVSDSRCFRRRFLQIAEQQDVALHHANVYDSGNDAQLRAVFEAYDLYPAIARGLELDMPNPGPPARQPVTAARSADNTDHASILR